MRVFAGGAGGEVRSWGRGGDAKRALNGVACSMLVGAYPGLTDGSVPDPGREADQSSAAKVLPGLEDSLLLNDRGHDFYHNCSPVLTSAASPHATPYSLPRRSSRTPPFAPPTTSIQLVAERLSARSCRPVPICSTPHSPPPWVHGRINRRLPRQPVSRQSILIPPRLARESFPPSPPPLDLLSFPSAFHSVSLGPRLDSPLH